MCSCGILTTNIMVLICLFVTGTYGMADQCIRGPDIVPVCSNVTIPTNQMFIPVNGSIGTGCMCFIQLVQAPDVTSDYPVSFVPVGVGNLTCGYQVDVRHSAGVFSISCARYTPFRGGWRLRQLFRLNFTRDSTSFPLSTESFCLQVYTQIYSIIDVRLNMRCWKLNTPTTIETPPSTTHSAYMSSQQTEETPSSSSSFLSQITHTQRGSMSSQQTTRPTGTFTTVQSKNEVTDNPIVENLPVAVIGGGIGGTVLLLIGIIVIVILCKRRPNKNYDQPSDRITDSTNYNNLRVKDEMVVMDNDLYVSYDDDKNKSITSPTSDIQHVQGHTYANTNRHVLPDATHSTTDLQPVLGHTYANIDDQQLLHTNHSNSDLHHVQPSVITSDNKSTDDMIILENDLYVSAD